ncbi:hypothetical protein [Nocardioides sp. CER19]|uniref:hypothetical protein n=1 Tax=Nocardioides sp. CER19 TaxID=3038538 RepID=UPI002449FFEA|nr:hypothetical protein [Nocardioides sp. CER19]MDH2414810.1 hypothetical protein [Nocardioides sp. CER19]
MTRPVQFDEPTATELQTVARTKILFGHQSVGANLLGALPDVYRQAHLPAPLIVETRDVATSARGFIAHAYVGRNGDPLGKLADFSRLVDGPLGDDVDVALVKFCYADIVAGTDVRAVFDAYTSTMADLAARHPDVRFLYTTAPLTADRNVKAKIKAVLGRDDGMGPDDNRARQRYNELIREEYGMSGRLFDIAAVESTMQATPTRRGDGDGTYYVLNDNLRSDRGHLNEQGAEAAAAEFVRVVSANAPAR